MRLSSIVMSFVICKSRNVRCSGICWMRKKHTCIKRVKALFNLYLCKLHVIYSIMLEIFFLDHNRTISFSNALFLPFLTISLLHHYECAYHSRTLIFRTTQRKRSWKKVYFYSGNGTLPNQLNGSNVLRCHNAWLSLSVRSILLIANFTREFVALIFCVDWDFS